MNVLFLWLQDPNLLPTVAASLDSVVFKRKETSIQQQPAGRSAPPNYTFQPTNTRVDIV